MPAPTTATVTAAGDSEAQEGSKIRRFFKRFGRRPSEENVPAEESGAGTGHPVSAADGVKAAPAATNATASPAPVTATGETAPAGKKTGSLRSRRGSKPGSSGNLKGGEGGSKKSDSILSGRFFHSSTNAPPLPKSQQQQPSTPKKRAQPLASPVTTPATAPAPNSTPFGGSSGEGLADTLGVPSSPPPQLDGLPEHDPIATSDLMTSPPKTAAAAAAAVASETAPSRQEGMVGGEPTSTMPPSLPADDSIAGSKGLVNNDDTMSSRHDSRSSSSDHRGHRDSIDNHTMDTQKSRASTKPTTLMSIEREGGGGGGGGAYGGGFATGNAPMLAQIAQHRHGDSSRSGDHGSNGYLQHLNNNQNSLAQPQPSHSGSPAIQFAETPTGRPASVSLVQLPGHNEPYDDQPYVNVPSLSRPHPSNNPHPGGQPGDDASVLTLASSTAAVSIGGGAASSRGHSHHAARSIGGSLMNERRNSSDTYASMKAIPPLSRRGSDASERTGLSVAASATGRNSAQAMTGAAGQPMTAAPSDRILTRTASQRTVATQLSIPLASTSTSNLAASSGGQPVDVPAIKTTAPPSSSADNGIGGGGEGDEMMQQHADELAAS